MAKTACGAAAIRCEARVSSTAARSRRSMISLAIELTRISRVAPNPATASTPTAISAKGIRNLRAQLDIIDFEITDPHFANLRKSGGSLLCKTLSAEFVCRAARNSGSMIAAFDADASAGGRRTRSLGRCCICPRRRTGDFRRELKEGSILPVSWPPHRMRRRRPQA